MSDHPLRLSIVNDLRNLITIEGSDEHRIDQILERLATAIYPVMKRNGVFPYSDKICIKCHKYHKKAEAMGNGIMCPVCREKSTYRPKLTAKVMHSVGTSKPINICVVKGETIPDLWANFFMIGRDKGYPHFYMSRLFKTYPEDNEKKWNFLFMADDQGKIIMNEKKGEKC